MFEWQVPKSVRLVRPGRAARRDPDVWAAAASDPAIALWLARPEKTGDAPFDALVLPVGPMTTTRPFSAPDGLLAELWPPHKTMQTVRRALGVSKEEVETALSVFDFDALVEEMEGRTSRFVARYGTLTGHGQTVYAIDHFMRSVRSMLAALSDLFEARWEGNKHRIKAAERNLYGTANVNPLISANAHRLSQQWTFKPTNLAEAIRCYIYGLAEGEREWRACRNPNCQTRPIFTVGLPLGDLLPSGLREQTGHLRRNAFYCSEACRTEVNNATRDDRARGDRPAKVPVGPKPTCLYCGERPIKRQHHCGAPACRQKHSRMNRAERAAK